MAPNENIWHRALAGSLSGALILAAAFGVMAMSAATTGSATWTLMLLLLATIQGVIIVYKLTDRL